MFSPYNSNIVAVGLDEGLDFAPIELFDKAVPSPLCLLRWEVGGHMCYEPCFTSLGRSYLGREVLVEGKVV